jgi:hypothetical protein
MTQLIEQTIPAGKRLVVRNARNEPVLVYEPGATVRQSVPGEFTTELVDLPSKPQPDEPIPAFDRLDPRLLLEALMELVGVTREEVEARAQQIEARVGPKQEVV